MQGKLQFATATHVAIVNYVMLMGYSDAACRGFAHLEICNDPDPLLLFGGENEHHTYHHKCSCMMRMRVTRLSKRATRVKLPCPDTVTFHCLVIAPMDTKLVGTWQDASYHTSNS